MKALTVRNPWAAAIFHGGKLIENRSHGAVGWRHRGPLAIHTSASWSRRGASDPRIVEAFPELVVDPHAPLYGGTRSIVGAHRIPGTRALFHRDARFEFGVVIGVVDLVDVHPAAGCCEPWGEETYEPANPEARPPGRVTHLVLENPRQLVDTEYAKGQLGLWEWRPYDGAEYLLDRATL